MDRCLQCSQQSPQLAPQSVSDRPRTVKHSGSKMQSSKTAITQPYLNQLPHRNGAHEKTHLYLWNYIPAITNPHSQSLAYFQSESVTHHLPATMTCSPDVDFPHGDPQNAYPSLPLFGDDTSGTGSEHLFDKKNSVPLPPPGLMLFSFLHCKQQPLPKATWEAFFFLPVFKSVVVGRNDEKTNDACEFSCLDMTVHHILHFPEWDAAVFKLLHNPHQQSIWFGPTFISI